MSYRTGHLERLSGSWLRMSQVAVLIILQWLTAQAVVSGQQVISTDREYKVKAVYLYSFGRFVSWPDAPSVELRTSFIVGVVGESPIVDTLEQIAQKREINGRKLQVVRYATPEDYVEDNCHILFVSRLVSPQDAGRLLQRTRDQAVLTVTESKQHRVTGCVLNFIIDGEGVQFEIDGDEAQQKGLALDARPLRQGKKMHRQ